MCIEYVSKPTLYLSSTCVEISKNCIGRKCSLQMPQRKGKCLQAFFRSATVQRFRPHWRCTQMEVKAHERDGTTSKSRQRHVQLITAYSLQLAIKFQTDQNEQHCKPAPWQLLRKRRGICVFVVKNSSYIDSLKSCCSFINVSTSQPKKLLLAQKTQ